MSHRTIEHEKKLIEFLCAKIPRPDGGFHLDIGCGDGEILQHFIAFRRPYLSIGVEPKPNLSEIADDRLYQSMVDIYPLSFEDFIERRELDFPFDIVTAFEILEHVADLPNMLAQIRSVLVPGGRFLLCVPDREKLVNAICPDCGSEFNANEHVQSYNEKQLLSDLADAGFRTTYSLIYRPTWAFNLGLPDQIIKVEMAVRNHCRIWSSHPGKWIGVVSNAN